MCLETTYTATDLCTSLLWSGVCRQPVHVGYDDFLGESRWAGPVRTAGWSSRRYEWGAGGGAWWWVRGWHGRCCFGRGRRLWQDGGLLIGAGSGWELQRCFLLSGAGRVPMVQEAWAGVVSWTGPAVVNGSMVVEVMGRMGVVVLFGVWELEGTLAGVMERIEGSVVSGTSASVVDGGWQGLVDAGEGFERFVEAILEQSGGASEVQAGARLHESSRRFAVRILLSGWPGLSLKRSSPTGWRRFNRSLHFVLQREK